MYPETGRRALWWLDLRTTAAILATLALLLLAGLAVLLSIAEFGAIGRHTTHTQQVLRAADQLHAALLDAEVHERGYQLNGDRADLDACRAALPLARLAAQELRTLSADNAGQQRRLDTLEPLVDRRLALLHDTIESAGSRIKPAAERANNNEGKEILDKLRPLLTAIRDEELSQLGERSAQSEAALWWLALTTNVASLLTLIGGAGALLPIDRSTARRLEAKASLERSKEADQAREQEALRRSHGELQVALVEAEQARQVADELLHGVFRAAPLALVVLDTGGRVRLWNAAAERALGWSEAEVFGRPYPSVSPAQQAEFDEMFSRALGGATVAEIETQWYDKDGKRVDVSISAAPLRGPAGAVNGVLVVLADTGPRKTLEEQVHRAQKLEAVGRLAGGIAHDFNNLLTVINGCCDLLLLRFPEGDPARELIDAVHGAGERAAGLTRQLLAFGRRQILQPRILDLNSIISDLGKLLARLIGEDIALELAQTSAPTPVRGDRAQLEQVVMNLALNARDAMPRGGRLTIETQRIDIQHDDPRAGAVGAGSFVLLAVRDTGVGIDAAIQSHIFEPFFTTKEPGRGTGLGLATVYAIVQQAGGAVDFTTAPGVGTTVSVYLPLADRTEPAADPPSGSSATASGSETVLLVEDEMRVRKLVCEVLRRRGYTVLDAGDGIEALRVAAAHAGPIHLLVTDVVMPRLSGRALAEHLTALRPALKVLYLSGYTDEALLRHGVQEGAAFLHKPFSPDVLAQQVRAVLREQAAGLSSS
jgi:PAS domain S-box-containing protein